MKWVENILILLLLLFTILKHLKICLNASGITFNNMLSKILAAMEITAWHPFHRLKYKFPYCVSPQCSLYYSKTTALNLF